MSASMAEGIAGVLAEHERWESNYTLGADYYCTGCHIAYSLAANGYGSIRAAAAVGWDAAVGQMVYEDGTPVQVATNANPYRRPE